MNLTKLVFRTIDLMFDLPQNPIKMEKELEDVSCIADIFYSEKFPQMALDLYFLPREGKYPVIFEIHGGGFSAGDKKYRRCLCRYYAKHTGAMVVNVNYGVGEEQPCPLPMQQLTEAINWVAVHADEYSLDTSKFVVTGDSAGAFYACFLATLQHSEYLQKLFECKPEIAITATVLNCGLYDMNLVLAQHHQLLTGGVCKEMTGLTLEEAKASKYFDGLSPINFVTANFPHTLLIYAQNDVFCKGQGELLKSKLEEVGTPAECICAMSQLDNHTYSLTWITATAKQTNEAILNFLNNHFGNTTNNDESC